MYVENEVRTGTVDANFLGHFYSQAFGLPPRDQESDDWHDIYRACRTTQDQCCHLFIFHYQLCNPHQDKSKRFQIINVVSSLTFQLFPKSSLITNEFPTIKAYIRLLGTSTRTSPVDGLGYQRRGLNSFLLGVLQSFLSQNQNGPKTKVLKPPTIYTRHGIGHNDHDAAILFWRHSGFHDVLENDPFLEEMKLVTGDKPLSENSDFQYVTSNVWVWEANLIYFPKQVSIQAVLGSPLFPHFQPPEVAKIIQALAIIKLRPRQAHAELVHQEFDRIWNERQLIVDAITPHLILNWMNGPMEWTGALCSQLHSLIRPSDKRYYNSVDVYSAMAIYYFQQKIIDTPHVLQNLSARFRSYMRQYYTDKVGPVAGNI